MIRRLLTFLAIVALGPLEAPAATRPFPSLAKRPAETREPQAEAAPAAIVPAATDPELVQTVATLKTKATAGDTAFRTALDKSRPLAAAAAGAKPVSEAWVQAQIAISAADAARYESVSALAGLDTLHIDRRDSTDGARIAADTATIDPARAQVLAMVDAQNDALDALRSQMTAP